MNQHTHVDSTLIDSIGALTTAAVAIQEDSGTYHLVLPAGFQHVDITKQVAAAQPSPARKSGAVSLSSIDSFNTYVADQGAHHNCYIFADPESRMLTAVLNEHDQDDREIAGWRDFRASYRAELSREFAVWMGNNKTPMEQEAFAIFLEDNIADICEPSGETVLAVALSLQAKSEVNFSSARRLDNGQVQLTYSEVIDARAAGGNIDIPREFTIGVRLFKNDAGYKVRARLKYRLGAGKVKFWYELDRPENAIEEAFESYVIKARETGFTVLIGKA